MNHPIAPLLKRYFSCYLLTQRSHSVNTIAGYRDAVKLLLCFIAEVTKKSPDSMNVEDLDQQRVLDFLDYVEEERDCCVRTRNARLAAIRSLFGFIARCEPELLVQCGQIRAIPQKLTQHKVVSYLEESEMNALLNSVDLNSRTGVRDRALLLLMYNTGARVSEITGIQLDDLRLDDSAQVHLLGKGRKERSCPLWPETVAALEAYIHEKRTPREATKHVFLNANGRPITRFGIRYVIRKYGLRAQPQQRPDSPHNDKLPTPHTIRHTTAMHLMRAGNDINTVSYWLGHADLSTTHIYIEIDMEMKRKMLAATAAPEIDSPPAWHTPDVLEWLDQLTMQPALCEVDNPNTTNNSPRKKSRQPANFT
jgi:site-specific recombinase XerD